MRDERGFALVETLCALVLLSLALLLFTALWHGADRLERRAAMEFAVSREAVNVLERWMAVDTVPLGTSERELQVQGVTVRERMAAEADDGLIRLSLLYAWREGERHHEQTWAALHR